MLFNSFSFLVFLPIVFLAYYALPHRFRRLFLLLASCYFYMAFVPKYVLILFLLITSDYFLAISLDKHEGKKRKALLSISIIVNLAILFFFKYFNFFSENIADLAHALHFNYTPVLLTFLLPLGLSFHVFQSLSYVIEVYRKKYKPEKNYITYALYVMFFPQLVAGPIERPQHLLPQLSIKHQFDPVLARKGLERMLIGFFKKVVIADQLAQIINPLFASMPHDGATLIVMALLFTYQIYCDFSGYSDIAIGSAMLLGFQITENFDRPFASRSIAEFWRRWHISLSSWLRDYLYYPLVLSGKGVTKARMYWSSFITFVLIGLWHGANWGYVIFGALHGFYMVIGMMTLKMRDAIARGIHLDKLPRLRYVLQMATVFILVAFSFIFFRTETVGHAFAYISDLGNFSSVGTMIQTLKTALTLHVGTIVFAGTLLGICVLEILQYIQAKKGTLYIFDTMPKALRFSCYYALIVFIFLFGHFGAQSFIYFQF